MRSTLALIALFVAGQVAALRLVEVQPYAVFQHYVSWHEVLGTRPVALAVLLAQTVVCGAVAGPARIAAAPRALGRLLGPWRLLLALGALGFALAVPTGSPGRFGGELLLAGWVAVAAALNLVLIAATIPTGWLDRAAGWVKARVTVERDGEIRPWDRALPWVAGLWMGLLSALFAWFVFEGVPHIDDSVMYLFQAKLLALGELYGPPPPDSESFAMTHLIHDGEKVYGKFFPGWPALLALGVIAGTPWLVNPLLGAALIPLAHALALRLYDRATANATALLLAASPWLLFTASEMMSHAAALAWAVLALLAIDLQRGRRAGGWSAVAGFALGALYLTRPFDAALLAPVAVLWAWGALGSRRLSTGSLGLIFAVAVAVSSLGFLYNAALTGHASYPPHRLWADAMWGPGVDVLGFGPDVGIPRWRNVDPLPGHGPADIVLNTNKNLSLLGFELFGWATGSLILAVLACVIGPWRRGDAVMLALTASVIGGHAFYWTHGGPDFGPRYWTLLLVPAVALTVRGAQMLAARLSQGGATRAAGARIGAAVLVASLTALACVVPWRAAAKYHRYRGIGADVREFARDFGPALVFVRSSHRSDYQSAVVFNPARLEGRAPIYAMDAGPAHRAAVIEAFPDRPIWIVGRPDPDEPRLAVLAGPLPPGRNPPGAGLEYERPLQADLR